MTARIHASRRLPAIVAALVAGWWLLDRLREPGLTDRTRERLRPHGPGEA